MGSSPGGPSQIGGPSFTYNSGAFQQGFGLGVTGRQAEPPPGGQGPLGQVGFGHSSLGQGVAPGPFGQGPLAQGPLGQGPLAQVYSFDRLEEKFPPLGQSLDRSGYRNIVFILPPTPQPFPPYPGPGLSGTPSPLRLIILLLQFN